jgi:signal transduction histidine kinase
MNSPAKRHVSLLWRVLLSTSIAITLLFGGLGWVIQDQFARSAEQSLEEEVRASFQAYESLWKARLEELASVSSVLSRMPDVRAAFGTKDPATIQDTAAEAWERVKEAGTLLLVASPTGTMMAPVAGPRITDLTFVQTAAKSFPAQARGFVTLEGRLYQIVVTPVYVASTQSEGLLNVLVAGIAVDSEHVADLKHATGGSNFVFVSKDQVVASTLPADVAQSVISAQGNGRLKLGGAEYFSSTFPLTDLEGHEVGRLAILRSFEAAQERISNVRWRLVSVWIAAVFLGLTATYWLTRRILQPLQQLDAAAAEIGRGNYQVQVPVKGSGEIARLTESFNTMSGSLTKAREDLIRQERISTIGRLSTSIIHDLRNPLAAIYGGSEMLVDHNLSPSQVQRLASNIYKASRQVQNMLQELADVTKGRGHARELCRLREVVQAAYEPLAASAEARHVDVDIRVTDDIELPLDRAPMERVFQNLITNAIEAVPEGGSVQISAAASEGEVLAKIVDNGPGIPAQIAAELFQPFVTAGKKNGLGLGLALARKTVLSHGGDLWVEPEGPGARFTMRLPV